MRASDVQRKEGIALFNVSDDNTGQSLKTEAARALCRYIANWSAAASLIT